ncbi:MAG: ABC transporter substrate-binding protein [Microbacterium sp.]|uniref:ABC transporter substrate-binding protein n=1 Tax=Microbacterium sp. TaxID=51671 RepID=UPI0039E7244F
MIGRLGWRTGAGIAAAALVALSLTACSGTSTSDSTSARGDVLRVSTQTMESINPALSNQAAQVPRLAYESLLDTDDDGTVVGQLAEDWSWDDDTYTSLTLTLRDGLSFSDGDALDADAVVGSFEYFVGAGGPNASLYGGITSAKVDDDTVRFTSEVADPDLPLLLTGTYFGGSVISPTGVADPTLLETESHGIGPYVYSDIQVGSEYDLVPSDTYYDQSRIHFDSVELPVISTESAQTAALLSDQVDLVYSSVSTSWSSTLAAHDDLTVTLGTPAWLGLELLDTQGEVVPALGDERVRQAIMYALDRDAITTAVFGGLAGPRVQAANSTWLGFDDALESTYAYDPDAAKELLSEAGYADGFTIPVVITGEGVASTFMQAIDGYLSAVGIHLDIQTVPDIAGFAAALATGTVAGAAMPMAQSSVSQFIDFFYGENAVMNPLGQVDDRLVALTETARATNAESDWTAVLSYIDETALTVPISSTPDIWVSADTIDVSAAHNPATSGFDITDVVPAS